MHAMTKVSDICCFLMIVVLFGNMCKGYRVKDLNFGYKNNVISSVNQNNQSEIKVYEIKRGNFSVNISNYGATVVSAILPDKNGNLDDVVLGFESMDEYKNDTTYFGGLIGRVANRIGGGRFTLNDTQYQIPINDNARNTLHGGTKGFNDVIWTVKKYKPDTYITLSYLSFDGEMGFPGELSVVVTYVFIGTNKLALKMQAKPLNKATPVNLASHTYWNLAGQNSGDILSHTIQLFGSNITPVNNDLIPTGEIIPVQGTPYDFLQPAVIGSKINGLPDGYDVNYVLDDKREEHLKKVAVVHDNKSGRRMELWTNKPGVQFYTSNMVNNVKGKGGFVYRKHAAICLETQGFPDAVNHPNFPSQIVSPGETYEHVMVYRFTTSNRN